MIILIQHGHYKFTMQRDSMNCPICVRYLNRLDLAPPPSSPQVIALTPSPLLFHRYRFSELYDLLNIRIFNRHMTIPWNNCVKTSEGIAFKTSGNHLMPYVYTRSRLALSNLEFNNPVDYQKYPNKIGLGLCYLSNYPSCVEKLMNEKAAV